MAFVIVVAVALVASVVSLLDSVNETVLTMYGYQRHFAVVSPRNSLSVTGDIEASLRRQPMVTAIYTARPAFTVVKTIAGKMPFVVFGLPPDARKTIFQVCQLRMASGRLPADGKPEVALSADIARNRRLKLGDAVLKPQMEDSYSAIPMRLVGTFDGPVWLAMTSESFVRDSFPVTPQVLVIMAKDEPTMRRLDTLLDHTVDKSRARTWTYNGLVRDTQDALSSLYLILDIVIAIVVFAIAFLTGMLANIYFTQRLPEFATLAAIGYQRGTMLLRVLGETALLCTVGWVFGSLLTVGVLEALRAWVMYPRGMLLDPYDLAAYRFTLPLPAAVGAFAVTAVWQRLRMLDPVTIIERRA